MSEIRLTTAEPLFARASFIITRVIAILNNKCSLAQTVKFLSYELVESSRESRGGKPSEVVGILVPYL
jgi:hypothetical protein